MGQYNYNIARYSLRALAFNPLLSSFLSLSLFPVLINCPVRCRQQRPARTINFIYTLRPPRCKQAALHFFSSSNRSPLLDHVEEANRFNCSLPAGRISMDFDRRKAEDRVEKGGGKRSNYSESRIIYYFVCTRGRSRATMTPIKFIHLLYLPCKHVARPYRDAILDARIFPSTRGRERNPSLSPSLLSARSYVHRRRRVCVQPSSSNLLSAVCK